jgi:AcrR family transcriptional regulator
MPETTETHHAGAGADIAATPNGRRPYHHGNLRSELLAEAERTVREEGIDRLSLRELARATGVSHAAPRRHFPDRQALLDALAENGFERLGRELQAALNAAGPGFAGRLAATATAYAHFATSDAALLELMFAGKHRDPSSALHVAAERSFSIMIELIVQGQRSGALRAGDPERVGLVLFATLQGIAALVSAGMVARDQVDGLVSDATAYFVRGSRAPA